MEQGLWGVAISNGIGFALFVYLFLETRKDHKEQLKYATERSREVRDDSNEREERYQTIVCGLTEALQTNRDLTAGISELRTDLKDTHKEIRSALGDLFKLIRKEC